MADYYPLVQPNFEATVPASFAANWEIYVRPRGGSESEEVQVYGDEEGVSKLTQPLRTGRAGRIGEGDQFGWVKAADLPVDLWGRPKGRDDIAWQVLPEGDQAVVAGGIAAAGKADLTEPGGVLVEAQLPDSVVSGSHTPVATPGVPHVINVKDGAFGAVGNGTTNDTAAVEAAVAALPEFGGEIFFPAGIYRIENLVVTKSNVRFVGAGNPGDGVSGSFTTGSFSSVAWCAKEAGAWIVKVGSNEGSPNYRGQGFENIAFFDSSESHETIEGALLIRRVNNGWITNCNFHNIRTGYAIKTEPNSGNPQWWRLSGVTTFRVKFGFWDEGSSDFWFTKCKFLGVSGTADTGVKAGSVGLYLYGSASHLWGVQVQYFEKEIVLGGPSESGGHHKLIDVDFESSEKNTEPPPKVGIEVHGPNNVILSNVGWAQRYSEKCIHILPEAIGTQIIGFSTSPKPELETLKLYVNDEGVGTIMRRTPNYSGIWTPMQAAKFEGIETQPPRETMPVHIATGNVTLTSGQMALGLLPVEPGDLISKLGFATGSTAATFGSSGYHWWMALYTTAGVLLSQSADQLNAAIATSTTPQVSLETPYRVPQGVHALYVGLMVNVGTGGSPAMPTVRGNASTAILGGAGLFTGARNYAATAGSGLGATAPAPATMANLGNFPYFGAC